MKKTNLPPAPCAPLPRKMGILLINLGTPDAPEARSLRRYLKTFLSDRRVIETNPLLWWFILNGIILNTRPKRSAHAYGKIWNHDKNESPLKTITRSQSEQLSKALAAEEGLIVDWAMRYSQPAVGDKIKELQDRGCDRILLFPLYPQYSAATTASALDQAFAQLKKMRWQPALRIVPPYYEHEAYIHNLARSLQSTMNQLSWKPERLLISFHGIPKAYHDKGDPYYNQCRQTALLLRQRLGLAEDFAPMVFQSRFGKAEWLQPYADETTAKLAMMGIKNLLVISPGFAADCVETLEELAIALKHIFQKNGGLNFAVAPCLNDNTDAIAMLRQIAIEELQGWLK